MTREEKEKKRSRTDRKRTKQREDHDDDQAKRSPARSPAETERSSRDVRNGVNSGSVRESSSRNSAYRDSCAGKDSTSSSRVDDRSRKRRAQPHSRSRSRSRSPRNDLRSSDEPRRKQRRLEGEEGSRSGYPGGRERERERSRRSDRDNGSTRRDGPSERARRDVAAASAVAEARDDALRAKEANDLDTEMEKRRKRVEAWQKLQRKKPTAAAVGDDAAAATEAEPEAKKWSFEDEDSDEEVDQKSPEQLPSSEMSPPLAVSTLKPLATAEEEIDPLDAFMAGNIVAAGVPASKAESPIRTAVEGDDEIDPLDAFMADLPQSTASKPKPKRHAAPKVVLKMDTLPGAIKSEPATAGGPSPALVKQDIGASMMQTYTAAAATPQANTITAPAQKKKRLLRRRNYETSDSSDAESEDEAQSSDMDDAEWAQKVQQGKLTKGDRLGPADHANINYPPFRRNFYIEVPELARMTQADVAASRKELDEIKVRGKDVPRPVKTWFQCGLSGRVVEALRKGGMTDPMPIQAQALPIIMSGRDCIGVAKTGSGKTLAFVLPMLRHIKDQPPLQQNDGPIALIMAPTRELVQQIGKDVKRFTKALNISCTCVYGGSGVANQITELKRGTEVVVCTPGRMIDILVTSGGKITNMRRVTYLVMDEADRMFDMGFEPQISRIVNNIRPDRQTVMFSATFPRSVEVLARAVLQSPVEIQVGGRSVVNSDITQLVEVREEEDRFLRLLEILGIWYERGKVLVFVQSQDKCDTLFRDLLKSGYPCLSLHGGKDQSDRESTITDFKSNVCNVLVATSVAARGLDVKELVLVVNYEVPNHHEDYVHRVGRTGRAGAKGTAITFIAANEERYAPDLVKALRESGAPIPKDLEALSNAFNAKRKAGTVQAHGSGFGGSGFKFDDAEDERHNNERKGIVKEYGVADMDEEEAKADPNRVEHVPAQAPKVIQMTPVEREEALKQAAHLDKLPQTLRDRVAVAQQLADRMSSAATVTTLPSGVRRVEPTVAGGGRLPAAPQQPVQQPSQQSQGPMSAFLAAAQAAANAINVRGQQVLPPPQLHYQQNMQPPVRTEEAALEEHRARMLKENPHIGGLFDPALPHYEAELEINDFPQKARWKITHRDTMSDITENTGAAITTRGVFVPTGRAPAEGERKLVLLIQGPTEQKVLAAKENVKSILAEETDKAMRREGGAGGAQGRYSIM